MAYGKSLLEGLSHDRKLIEGWFETRAKVFTQRAAHGILRKTIDADEIRSEFKMLARELDSNNKILEKWFDARAIIFIQRYARGWKDLKIDVDAVKEEFRGLAREMNMLMDSVREDEEAEIFQKEVA